MTQEFYHPLKYPVYRKVGADTLRSMSWKPLLCKRWSEMLSHPGSPSPDHSIPNINWSPCKNLFLSLERRKISGDEGSIDPLGYYIPKGDKIVLLVDPILKCAERHQVAPDFLARLVYLHEEMHHMMWKAELISGFKWPSPPNCCPDKFVVEGWAEYWLYQQLPLWFAGNHKEAKELNDLLHPLEKTDEYNWWRQGDMKAIFLPEGAENNSAIAASLVFISSVGKGARIGKEDWIAGIKQLMPRTGLVDYVKETSGLEDENSSRTVLNNHSYKGINEVLVRAKELKKLKMLKARYGDEIGTIIADL